MTDLQERRRRAHEADMRHQHAVCLESAEQQVADLLAIPTEDRDADYNGVVEAAIAYQDSCRQQVEAEKD